MGDDLDHELQRHAGALRCLARDLLRDHHAAEDVTQATLQQALAHRQLRAGPLGGWLHRTLVNFAHQWRRRERRRAHHEGALPAPAAAPATVDVLSRRELLRLVTDEVLKLEEPYQTAIFLRYFEGLPPRAIARATGTNVASIKSRLARGLALLRASLDRSNGPGRDWQPALVITFGVAPAALLPLTGAMLMSAATKSVLAACLVCAGGLWWLSRVDEQPPEAAQSMATANALAAANAANTDLPQSGSEATRETGSPAALAPDWLQHPFDMSLTVRVIDELGVPVVGQQLHAAPAGCQVNATGVVTDADGRCTLSWKARQPQMAIDLMDPLGRLRRIAVSASEPTAVTLIGKTTPTQLDQRISFVATSSKLDGRMTQVQLPATAAFLRKRLGDIAAPIPDMGYGTHPFSPFVMIAEEAQLDVAFHGLNSTYDEAIAIELWTSAASFVAMQPSHLQLFNIIPLPEIPPTALIGLVRGIDGTPAPGVPVLLFGAGPQPQSRTTTDEAGGFAFTYVPAGNYTVRAGGDFRGLATTDVAIASDTVQSTLQLDHGNHIRGRAQTTVGVPLVDWIVEWRAHDDSWCDRTPVTKDGSFVFANLPAGPGRILLFDKSEATGLPQAVHHGVSPSSGELLLVADPECRSTLRFVVPTIPNAARQSVRLRHHESGLGVETTPRAGSEEWSSEPLAAGTYEVELCHAGAAPQPLGRHWLDGSTPVDLGRIDLAQPGTVTLQRATGDGSTSVAELVALRADVDLRHVLPPTADPVTLALPAGNYAILVPRRDGTLASERFLVRPGQRQQVTVPDADR